MLRIWSDLCAEFGRSLQCYEFGRTCVPNLVGVYSVAIWSDFAVLRIRSDFSVLRIRSDFSVWRIRSDFSVSQFGRTLQCCEFRRIFHPFPGFLITMNSRTSKHTGSEMRKKCVSSIIKINFLFSTFHK